MAPKAPIGTVVWNVLHNGVGKIHISAPSNRATPIMRLSTYFHKRKKACYINRQFGVLKRWSSIKNPIGKIAYAAMRQTALILTAIIQI